jgi:membrane protease YdiL (CAAX protease family)
VPAFTVWSLLLMAAPVVGIIEEAAFRGYMQGSIERRYGLAAAIYGTVTYLANSVWPAVVLHTGGNVYSNVDLLLHGQAEWQAPASAAELIWATGADSSFLISAVALLTTAGATLWAYSKLAGVAKSCSV